MEMEKEKGFAIIRKRAKHIEIEGLHSYKFEKDDGIKPQKVFAILPSKREAQRYIDKWNNGKEVFRIIEVEIDEA